MTGSFKQLAATGILILGAVGAPAQAHEVWMAQRSAQLALIYGSGAEDLDTVKRFAKIVSIKGHDAAGKALPVSFKSTDSLVVVNVEADPAMLSTVFDNGLWSKRPNGEWVAKGRDEVTDAVVSGHNYKYNTHLRKLPPGPSTAIPDMKLQLVAVGKVFPRKAGDKLTVQVLYDGKPLSGARVFQDMVTNPSGKAQMTDRDGIVTMPVRNDGLNVVMAMHVAAPEDPAKTFMTEHVATLSFIFDPPPE